MVVSPRALNPAKLQALYLMDPAGGDPTGRWRLSIVPRDLAGERVVVAACSCGELNSGTFVGPDAILWAGKVGAEHVRAAHQGP
jgi:hypothetical protein